MFLRRCIQSKSGPDIRTKVLESMDRPTAWWSRRSPHLGQQGPIRSPSSIVYPRLDFSVADRAARACRLPRSGPCPIHRPGSVRKNSVFPAVPSTMRPRHGPGNRPQSSPASPHPAPQCQFSVVVQLTQPAAQARESGLCDHLLFVYL